MLINRVQSTCVGSFITFSSKSASDESDNNTARKNGLESTRIDA